MEVQQILIVDDDVDFREGLQMVLSDYCGSVLMADNDARAAGLAASLAPDAALIDPGEGGLDTARQIKTLAPQTRVILLPLFDRYRAAAREIGADGYVLKGCPTEELLAAIDGPPGRLGKEG